MQLCCLFMEYRHEKECSVGCVFELRRFDDLAVARTGPNLC